MAKRRMKLWLMKSEPDVYSIDDLERDGSECWEGVRNYQARNFMREMAEGDLALFYHYANTNGRKVLATVAGHMHRKTKSGKRRPGQIEKDGVLYVNAAEVPRHRKVNGIRERHHVKLTVTGNGISAEDLWV